MSDPARILIVDDDANLRQTLSDILESRGFAPLACETGMEAIECVGQEEIIVALIDLRLADISGLEVVRGIKERSPQTECILLTGHASQSTAIDAVNLGAYSYYQKPYDIEQLLLSIRHAVDKRLAGKALTESQARYHTFINATTDIAFLKDSHFRYLIVNEAGARFFEKPGAEIIGKNDFELLAVDVAQAIRQSDEQVLEANRLVISFEEMRGRVYEFRQFPVDLQDGRLGVGGYIRDITESRMAETALRESEERYRMLAENMTDTIWLMDLNLHILYASPSVIRQRGYTLDELNALPLDQQMTPDSLERLMQLFTQVPSLENPARPDQPLSSLIEMELFKKDGSKLWVEGTFTLILNANGQATNILGSGRDVTERKQAEDALRASEENYRSLFENIPDGVYRTALDGKLLAANPALVNLFGYESEAELKQINAYDLYVDPKDRDSFVDRAQTSHEVRNMEVRLRRKDGQHIHGLDNARALLAQDGTILYIEGTLTDITARKNAEDDLRKSEIRFRSLIENAPGAITLLDANGRLKFVSSSTERILGYTIEETLGANPAEYTHPDDLSTVLELLQELIQKPGQARTIQYRVRHKDGSWRWVESTINNLLQEPGIDAITFNFQDITIRKTDEEALNLQATALNAAANAIVITDRQGNIEWVNPAWSMLTGYSSREVIGQTLRILKSGLQDDAFYKSMWDTILSGQVWESELVNRRKNGTLYNEHETITPVLGESGEVTHFVAIKQDITTRKQAEAELRASEQRYQSLIEVSPVGIFRTDAEGLTIFVSHYWCKISGLTAEKALGNGWLEAVDLTEREALSAGWVQVVREKKISNSEYRFLHPDGSSAWVMGQAIPQFDATGEFIGHIGTITDITARKQTDELMRRHMAELEVLYESSLTISRLLNPREIAQSMVETLSQKLEWHHAVVRQYHPETNSIELLALHQPHVTSEALPGEIERLQQTIQFSGVGLSGWVIEHGEAVCSVDVNTDPRYIQTYPDIRSGLYVPMKLGDRVIGCISVESNLPAAFDEQDQRLLNTMAAQAAIAIHQAQLYEQVQQYATELEKRVEARTIDLQRANLDLARAARMKDEFLASMSHELRTPLTGILGLSESMQLNTYGELSGKQLKILKMIEDSGRHLLALINDILDLSKIEAGKFDLQIEPCSLAGMCQASLQMTKGMAQQKHQQTSFSISPDSIIVRADARRLKQMLVNLLSNAVKFTPEAGRLGIEVRGSPGSSTGRGSPGSSTGRGSPGSSTGRGSPGSSEVVPVPARDEVVPVPARDEVVPVPARDEVVPALARGTGQGSPREGQVRITVWDTGIGIQDEDLPRLFQPFVQLDSSLSRQYAGTGLGLSLVQRMAALHGGHVEVESTPGAGSRFTLVLPWETEATPAADPNDKIFASLHRALTIDENEVNAESLTRYLKDLGVSNQIQLVALGAVEQAAQIAPDVILVHLNLPDKSGLELLADLKADERTRKIPVIIMSVEEKRSEAMALGAAGFLVKPISLADLQVELKRVATLMSKPESAPQAAPVVLLADDNEIIREVVADFLRTRNFQVSAVNSGRELLECVEEIHPDILLVDIQMPGMDGLEAMRRIRAHTDARISAMPMIAVTALAMSGDRERCVAAGANEYMSKPLHLEKLVEVIRELCKR